MKMQRKWRRAWQRGKPHWAIRRPKARVIPLSRPYPVVDRLLRKARPLAASVAIFSLLTQQAVTVYAANEIIKDGTKTATTINVNGNITDISTATHSSGGNIGFNAFTKFNIDSGQIVNLQLGSAGNLINLVNDSQRSTIHGTLNSIKNSAIGGNVYFLNPHGLLVGTSGVINVGSFTAMTPAPGVISSFNGSNLDAWGTQILNGSLPVNPAGSITVQGKINAIQDIKLAAGVVEHSGALLSRAHFTATAPDFSDVVNVNGAASGANIVVTDDGKIEIVAKKIDLQKGSLITAKDHKGNDGDIALTATDTGSLDNGIFSQGAAINLDGATLSGRNITLSAKTAYTDNALLGITVHNASATIDAKDSSINASGDVSMTAGVDIALTAKTPSFMAKLTGDSAFAGAAVNSTARVKLDGTTAIAAGGDVKLAAENKVNLTVSAKAADNKGESEQANGGDSSGGGSLGFGIIRSTTEAGITGQATISQSKSITVDATSVNKLTTEAVSSIKGATQSGDTETSETKKKLADYQDDAQTSEGKITAAAALGINDISSVTKAYMDSTATAKAIGSVAVTSRAANQSAVTADGSAVEAGATGVGVAVGINKVSSDHQAYVNQQIQAKDLSVQAIMNGTDTNSLTTKVSSGAGATDVGVAGALAVNVHVNETLAQIGGKGNIILTDNVTVTAKNESNSIASAIPTSAAAGGKVGVGASVVTNIGVNHVTAEIADGAKLSGAKDVSLSATGKHSLETVAKAGSKGGVSVTPVVALTVADNQATAKIGTGDLLNISGNLSVKADNTGSSKTIAEGQADGEKAAIGAAIAITVAVDQAEAMTARSINAGGGVSFQADNVGASATTATASAAGGKAAKADGTAQDGDKKVDDKTAEQLDKASQKKGADGKSISDKTSDAAKTATNKDNAPKAETSEGSVSVAAAVGINTGIAGAKAHTVDGANITAANQLALKTSNNATATTKADGTVVGKDGADPAKVGIGVAVAVNVATVNNQATLGKGTHQAGGLDISATMRDTGTAGSADKTSTFGAEASSGTGASDIGVAGSVAVNVVDNSSVAKLATGADLTVTGGDASVTAENNSESTAKAIPHEKATASGKTVGVGASIATNIGINHVAAEIADGAKLSGGKDVSLAATGKHSLTTEAKAGSKGGISVTPVVAVAVADNQATAKIGTGDPLNITGNLNVKADNTGSSKTTAEGQADGEKAAIGAAIAITVAVDQAEAMTARSINAGGGVSFQADNTGASATTATASAAGGKAAKADGTAQDGDKKVDDKTAEQLDKASQKKGADGTSLSDKTSDKAKTALNKDNAPKAETSEGSVSVAAAIGINTGIASAKAHTVDGVNITANNQLALKTSNNATATAKADGTAVGKAGTDGANIGIGAAVAINVASANNQATLGQGTHKAGGLDISAAMREIGAGDKTSTFGAEASSGAGAADVGIAGSVAVNVVDNSSVAKLATGANLTVTGGDASVTAENNSESTAKAIPHEKATASGKTVGVGASVATNIGINHVTAEIADGATLSGAKDVSLSATGKHSLTTEAKAGSKGGVSITPAVAVTVADNQAVARIGTGDPLNITGNLNVKADNTGSSKTTAEGQADGEKAAIGAAVAINVAVDQAEAMTARSITSTGGGVSFQADNAGASETIAKASAAGGKAAKADGTAQDGEKNVDEKNAEQIDNAGKKKGADGKEINTKTSSAANTALDKNNAPKAETSEGSVSVAAAVGVNVGTASAKAYTADGASITAADKLSLQTSNNNAANVQAEGKAVSKKDTDGNKVGVAAAVAINVANLTNTAKLGAANHSAKGLEITAVMRDTGTAEKPDTINNFTATATSGAGASKVGIAGSLALNVITNTTGAEIAGGAAVNAGSGDVTLKVEQTSVSEAKALPGEKGASGGNVGIGASVAINIINDTTKASINDNAGLTNAGAVKVTAAADHDTTTEAKGGAAGGVAIDAVGAVTALKQNTQATIGTGSELTATSVEVESKGSGDHKATATGDVESGNVGIGASAAVITSDSSVTATVSRDITATGSLSVKAAADRSYEAIANASAKGAKPLGDGEQAPANPKNTSSKALKDTGDKQEGVKDEKGNKKTVDIAAAVGVTVLNDDVKAEITGGTATTKRNISAKDISIAALNTSDFSSRGSGAALDPQAKAGIGVGVGISVANNDTTASIGDYTAIKTGGNVAVKAESQQNMAPEFVKKLAAEGIAGAGGDKVGVAGALAVAYSDNTTKATVGDHVSFDNAATKAGDIAVTADNTGKLSAKAWSAAFGNTAGVGASVATIVSDNEYTASVGENGDIRANSLNVQVQNHKVSGSVPGVDFNTKDLNALKDSLKGENLQTILGANNYYTEAIAGAASGNVAVTGAVAVNYFQDKTTAAVGKDTQVATTGDLKVAADNDTTAKAFVTSVALSTGNAGVGLVSTNVINSTETTAALAGQVTDSGSVSVTAEAGQDIGVFGLGGGVANTAGVSGVATVAVAKNKVSAQVADNANIKTAGSLSVNAKNDVKALNVAASLAVGGTAGVGVAVGTTNVNNDTQAWIGKNAVVETGQDATVKAAASEIQTTIAAGGAGGGTAGVAGSAVVETVQVTTKAFVDQGAKLNVGQSLSIAATDDTKIGSFGGAVSFGGTAGVGAGAVVEVINKDIEASIKDSTTSNKTTITAGQDVVVAANASESITAAAASVAGGGTAGVAGSGIVYVVTNNTAGYIGDNADVHATGSAAVSAQDATTVNLLAGNVAIGGTAGVGGAVGVNVIIKNTDAHIGKNATVRADGLGAAVQIANGKFVTDTAYMPGENEIATPGTDKLDKDAAGELNVIVAALKPVKAENQAMRGVAVSAVSLDTVRSGAVGAAGGGTAGVQGSLSAGVTDNTTKAYIDWGANINTAQSVLVAAGSDFHRVATAGAVAVGGTAGVGLGNDTAVRIADTEAYIAQAAKVTAQKDIAVTANAAESIFSVTAAGAAGFNAGVAGALSVNVINNTTKAYIEDAATDTDKAVVKAGNNLRIAVSDDTNFAVMDGGVGFAILGGGVGGAVNVAVINKDTQAYVGDRAEVEALGNTPGANQFVYAGTDTKAKEDSQGLAVEAVSKENIADAVVAGGGAFVGVAGAVSTNIVTANTAAHIGSAAKVTAKDVNVTAVDDKKLFSAAGSAGVGVGGLAGSFNINIIRGNTTAYIDAADVNATRDVAVNALATKDITVGTVSAGGGLVGVAGSVSVLSLGGALTDENKKYLNTNGNAAGDTDSKAKNDQATQMIGGYNYKDENGNNIAAQASAAIGNQTGKISVSDAVNNKTPLPSGTTAAIRDGAKIKAGGDVALNARDQLTLKAASGSVAGGAGAVGAAVAVLTLDNDTTATINDRAEIDAKGKLAVLADWQQDTTAVAFAGAGGGFGALGAAVAIVNDDSDVRASNGNAAKLTAQGIDYQAASKNKISTQAINLAVGAGLSIGASIADVNLKGSTQAYIGNGSIVNSSGSSEANVNANTDNQATAKAQGGTAGFAGLGATVALVKDASGTDAYLGDNAGIEQAGAVGIKADYKADVNTEAIVVAGGFVGAGASVAKAEITGTNQAYTGTNSKISQTAGKTVGSLQLIATNDSKAKANAIAGAAGVGAGAGSAATAVVNPTSKALIGDGTQIKTSGHMSVQATGTGTADADASGLSLGGLAVGASVAQATNTSKLTAGIGANTTLNINGDLLVRARQTVDSDAKSIAAGGGLIGINATVAQADSRAQVNSSIGSGGTADVKGDITVEADAKTKQNAKATAVVGGFYAAGASVATAASNTDTTATVGGQVTAGSVGITAKATDDNFAKSTAGSGGVVSGAAAVVKTRANGSAKAALADGAKLTANTLAINASRTTRFDAVANSVNASAVGASGIIAKHDVNTGATAAVGNNVTIKTAGDTNLKAVNTSEKNRNVGNVDDWKDVGDWNLAAAGGGVVSGAAVDCDINVTHNTGVTVGNGSNLTAGHGGTAGSFVADAESNMTLREKARINAGGAIAVADVDSRINATADTKIDIGNAAIESETGKIKVGTKNNADLDNRVAADAYGVAGAPAGTAYSNFSGSNQVNIAEGAKLIADGDISLAAGRDTPGTAGTVNANAVVNLWNKTVVPINSKPNPQANITSKSALTIDGYVGSANDIYLTADKGAMNASYTGVGKDLYREALAEIGSAISNLFGGGDVNLDIKGGSKSTTGTANVIVNSTGTVETGLKRVKELSFGGSYQEDGSGGYHWVLDPAASEGVTYSIEYSKAIAESMTDRLNELHKLKAAYAGDANAVAAYDAEIRFLQNKMVNMGLAAWDESGGGKVFVPGISAGAGALSPKASAEAALTQMQGFKATVDANVTTQTPITEVAKTYRDLVKTREDANTALIGKQSTLDTYVNDTTNFTAGQKPADRADAVSKRAALVASDPTNPLIGRYKTAIDYYDNVATAQTNLTNAKTAITNANTGWDQNIALSTVQTAYETEQAKLDGFTDQQTAFAASITDLTALIPTLSTEVPKGPTADFITVNPITARLGDVRISADNLTGSGKLLAPGDAKISITNNSPAFLTVQDLIVRDGGSILFNGASVKDNAGINALNIGKSGAAFGQITTKSNSPMPTVTVQSNFNPNAADNKKLFNGVAVAIGIAPDITLAQGSAISNLNGLFKVHSKYGSIYANGSISAGTVDIEAANGDFVQSYVNGFTHVGGDPERIHKGTVTPGGIVANGNIFISARYLNVNGLIQSGIADWTLTLSNAVKVSVNGIEKTLDEAKEHYKNNGGTGLYTVVGGYSGNIGEKGYVSYDAKNERFEIGGVEVHGGLVQLHGQIINTAEGGASTGKIRALDGYGTINITNNSGKDIVLQNLNTGDGSAGVIDITDTGRGVHTVYKSDRGGVTVTENDLVKANSNYNYSSSGSRGTLIYSPQDNLYYNWTTGKDYSKTTYYHFESSDVFGYTYKSGTTPAGSPTYSNFGVETPLANGIYLSTGRPFTDSGTNYYAWNTKTIDTGVGVYHMIKEWTKRHWYTFAITGTYYQDYSITTPKKNINTYSVKASNPIGIEFFGQNSGTVSVSGNSGNVLLQGAITNKTGNTTISTGKDILQADSSALISTGNLTLNAGNIGTKDQAIRAVIGNTLTASTGSGSVNVTQVLGDLKLGNVNADNGTLRLTADGSIVNAAVSDVRGQRIELVSNNGGIGGASAPLIVKTGNTANYLDANYGLKAYALNDINIENKTWTGKNEAGNLLIDTVESRTGDVRLKTPGQMIDNNTDEQIDRRTWNELTSYWDSLQLRTGTADNAAKQNQAINSYINGKNADYQAYWQLNSRIVNGQYLFANGEQAALAAQGIDTADFAAKQLAKYQDLTNGRVGSWNGGQYNAAFAYAISADERVALLKGSNWTDRELAVSLAPGALKQLTDTNPIVKAPNVKGKNVTLEAGGGIGSNLAAIVIDATKAPQSLTPEEKVALAAAERADLIIDNVAKTISVTQRKPVNVEAGGLLTTISGSHAYLGSEAAVNLNYVQANGNVRLKTAGDIRMGDVPGMNDRYVIIGDNIILESANGGIGTDNMPLNLGHSGSITARAAKNIYLSQDATNPDMQVDTIYSLQDVSLTAAGNIQSSGDNDEGLNIMSKSLKLKAGKAIGSSPKALDISLDQAGKLTAEAQTGMNLSHTGESLTVAKAETAAGDIHLKAANDLIVEQAAAKAGNITIKADTMTLQQITAGNITAQADTNLTADMLTASGNIGLTAGQNITADGITAGGSINMNAQNDITADNTTASTSVSLTAGRDITASGTDAGSTAVMTAGRNLSAIGLTVGADASLTATNGALTLKQITATGNIIAQAGTNLATDTLTASGNIGLTAHQNIAADTTTADGSVTMNAGNDIAADNTDAGTSITLTAGNDVFTNDTAVGTTAVMTTGRNLSVTGLTVGTNANLTATNGAATLEQITAAGGITARAGTDLSAKTMTAKGNINLTAGLDITVDNSKADGSVAMDAKRDITADNTTAGAALGMAAVRDIKATGSNATDAAVMAAGRNLSVTDLTAKTGAGLMASDGTATLQQITATDGAINAQAGTDINANDLTAAGNIDLKAGQDIHVKQIDSATSDLSLTARRSILNTNQNDEVNLTGRNLSLEAQTGAIGAKDKRLVVVIPGDVQAEAAKDINLEVRSGDLNASSLISREGGIEVLVTDGAANITKAKAPGGTLILGASQGISLDELEVESLNLNSSGVGGTLNLGKISLGNSMQLSADNIIVGSIVHTGNTTPLQLAMTGGSKAMADTIRAAVSSDTGVVFTRFTADQATINANADNVSFLDARVGSWADFRNRHYYVAANNLEKRLIPSDMQIRPEDKPFFLVMAADRNLLTNALVINYSPDFSVNGGGNDNSLVRQADKLTVLSSNSSADHTGQYRPGMSQFITGFDGSSPTLSFGQLTTIIGDPVNLHQGQESQDDEKERQK